MDPEQIKVSLLIIVEAKNTSGSWISSCLIFKFVSTSRQIPSAPVNPGSGGIITSLPVCRTTAAAKASDEKGIP
jgi:hypothetical protein